MGKVLICLVRFRNLYREDNVTVATLQQSEGNDLASGGQQGVYLKITYMHYYMSDILSNKPNYTTSVCMHANNRQYELFH